MEAIMKRLILAVCLLFTVLCGGFAKNWYPKTLATDTLIGTKYDDGKIKYALTEKEIFSQLVYDTLFYLSGIIDGKYYQSEGLEKIGNIECKFFIRRTRGGEVYLKVHYSFVLMSYKYEGGIPLEEGDRIIDKIVGLTDRTWEHIKDPIIDEIKKSL